MKNSKTSGNKNKKKPNSKRIKNSKTIIKTKNVLTNHSKNISENNSNIAVNNYSRKVRLRIILLLLFVMIIGIGSTMIFYYNYHLLDIKVLNATVQVTPSASSFDAGTTRLNFARTFPGGSGIKYVDITSERDVVVKVKAIGDIAQFLTFSEDKFYIAKGDYKQLSIIMDIPESAPLGNYSGKVILYFYRS